MNEPKEEARILVHKFSELDFRLWIPANTEIAKQCAIKCCDEIIKALPDKTTFEHGKIGYWKEVRSEIELL